MTLCRACSLQKVGFPLYSSSSGQHRFQDSSVGNCVFSFGNWTDMNTEGCSNRSSKWGSVECCCILQLDRHQRRYSYHRIRSVVARPSVFITHPLLAGASHRQYCWDAVPGT